MHALTVRRLGISAAVLVIDTALLVIVGAAMWSEPPSSADEAVGKGLVAFGAALMVPTLAVVWAFVASRARAVPVQKPARSDWETV